jgi:peptidyl-dipeptidase A
VVQDPAHPESCLDIERMPRSWRSRNEHELREAWEAGTRLPCRCGAITSGSSTWRTPARASWALPTPATCGAASDMPADDFTKEVDRLWNQVKPLYLSLHAYVRMSCTRNTATSCR